MDRLAGCFQDGRDPELIEHSVRTLVMQRVVGIALGYEDLNDHDQLRHDPVLAVLAGKLKAQRKDCAPLAGKSTLNRLEHAPKATPGERYRKIAHHPEQIESLFVDLFWRRTRRRRSRSFWIWMRPTTRSMGIRRGGSFTAITMVTATCRCTCFAAKHLLAAKLRRSNIDGSAGAVEEMDRVVGQIRKRWPKVRITLRADSGFAREELMAWCESNAVDYVFGLAKNARLIEVLEPALARAQARQARSGKAEREFTDFRYSTRKSWSRERRVVGKGRTVTGSKQSALCGDLTDIRGVVSASAVRRSVLRSRGDGEPHQGMPRGPVRGSHVDGHHARQPVASVVVVVCLCPDGRAAAKKHSPALNWLRQPAARCV